MDDDKDGGPRREASGLTTRTFARSQSRAVDRLETPLSDDEYEDSPYAEAPPQIVARLSEGGKHARGFDVYPPLATVPASFIKPVWIHPNTLHCFPPELQTEYAERNEEMERQYHHLMHGGTADRAGAGGGKREKGPTGKGLSITAYTRTKQHAEEAAIRAQNARRDPVSQAADVAAKRRLFTKRKNQVEREIANVRTLRTGEMEKLLLKVNSLSDVRDDPLPLSQLFASRGLYYAALSVAASQPTALRTIAEEIEAKLTATDQEWMWPDADRDLLIANSSGAPLFADPKHVTKYRAGMKDVVLGPAPAALRKLKSQRLGGRSPSRKGRSSSTTPGRSQDSSRASTPQSGTSEATRLAKSNSRPQLSKGAGVDKPEAIEEVPAEAGAGGDGGDTGGPAAAGGSTGGPGAAAADGGKGGANPKSAGVRRPGAPPKPGAVTFDRGAPRAGGAGDGGGEASVLDDLARAELERYHTITAMDIELLQGVVKELLAHSADAQASSSTMGPLAAMAMRAAQAATRAAESAASLHAEVEQYQSSKATVPHDLEELQRIPAIKLLQNLPKATADALIARGAVQGLSRSKSLMVGEEDEDGGASRRSWSKSRSKSRSKSPGGRRRSKRGSRSPSPPKGKGGASPKQGGGGAAGGKKAQRSPSPAKGATGGKAGTAAAKAAGTTTAAGARKAASPAKGAGAKGAVKGSSGSGAAADDATAVVGGAAGPADGDRPPLEGEEGGPA